MEELYRSQFRLPYPIYEQLKASADNNHRSVNAELVARLERTFADDDQIRETAEYMAWREENPGQDSGESIVGMLAHLRSLISNAESGLKMVERLYDEKTGEHAQAIDKDGNIVKSYER